MATVRCARAEDEDDAMRLLAVLFGDRTPDWTGCRRAFQSLLDSPRGVILIADDAGAVAGLISMSFNLAIRYGSDYAQIEELIVDNRYRGQGLGGLLVNAAIETARRQGSEEIGLYAREHNRPFYEHLGFAYAGPEMRQAL